VFARISVGLDGSPHADTALTDAMRIAAASGGTVRGIHVVDRSMLEGSFAADLAASVGFQPFLNLTAEMRRALASAGEAIVASFETRAKELGLPFTRALVEGSVSELLGKAARECDLFVAGSRGVNAPHRGDLVGRHADALARRLRSPLLLAPETYKEFRSPLLAYDSSAKSQRALELAAELATLLKLPLEVLTVTENEAEGKARLAEAEKALAGRGIGTNFLARGGEPDDAILAEIEGGADLVAMGAHGHGRIRELMLGSTTDSVLRRATVPVLCA